MHLFWFLPSWEIKILINLAFFSRAKDRVNRVEKRKEIRCKKAKEDIDDKKEDIDDKKDNDDSGISIIWLYSSVLKASVTGGFFHILMGKMKIILSHVLIDELYDNVWFTT